MRTAPQTRSRLVRWLAPAVACAFVLPTLERAAHGVLVEHEVCGHGHLVHADDHEGEHRPVEAPLATDAPAEDASAATLVAEPTPHDHDHCELCLAPREERAHTERAVAATSPPPPATIAPRGPPADVRAPGVAVYRYAPKTSPPA